ncbi:MAG: enoyl-CoA hydratase-related protein, partial [Polyangiales bacterium]
PVIAAVHGTAFGGGLQIALGADLRYVTADAQLSIMEIKWGLIPDMSITQTLLKLVPIDVAKELTFTGRIVSGTEAVALGLATKVADDPLTSALDTAKLIASKSPHAIRAGKALLGDAPGMSRADALELETTLQVALLGSPNQVEAVQANMMKREPSFKDPD